MTSEPKWSRCHRSTGRGLRYSMRVVHAESLVAAGLLHTQQGPWHRTLQGGPALRRLARYARTLNSEQPGERTWEHRYASQLGPSWLVNEAKKSRARCTASLLTCRSPNALQDPWIGACGPTKLCPGSRRHGWGPVELSAQVGVSSLALSKHQRSGCGNATHTCRGMHVRLGLSNEAWPVG